MAGIDRLKSEVAAFRRLLALLQQDTQIPIDTRGTLISAPCNSTSSHSG